MERAGILRHSQSLLARHPLWNGVDSERVLALTAPVRIWMAERGKLVVAPEDLAGRLQLVLSGRLQAYRFAPDGRRVVVEIIPAGSFDGELSLCGERGHYSEATVTSVLASVSRFELERLAQAEPRIALNLTGLLTRRLERREKQIEAMTLRHPLQRLASHLLTLAHAIGRAKGEVLQLPSRLTHQALADMLGLRRETVTVCLGQLAEQGAILFEGRQILVLEPKLAEVAAPHPRGPAMVALCRSAQP